jgi:hypothetical protein
MYPYIKFEFKYVQQLQINDDGMKEQGNTTGHFMAHKKYLYSKSYTIKRISYNVQANCQKACRSSVSALLQNQQRSHHFEKSSLYLTQNDLISPSNETDISLLTEGMSVLIENIATE